MLTSQVVDEEIPGQPMLHISCARRVARDGGAAARSELRVRASSRAGGSDHPTERDSPAPVSSIRSAWIVAPSHLVGGAGIGVDDIDSLVVSVGDGPEAVLASVSMNDTGAHGEGDHLCSVTGFHFAADA